MKKKRENVLKGNRTLIISIVLVVLVVILIILLLNYPGSKKSAAEKEGASETGGEVSAPSDSLIFTASFYLNEGYDKSYCPKEFKCRDIYGAIVQCPRVDELTMRFRVFNFDSLAFISCRVNDGNDKYTDQHFAYFPVGKTAELSLQNIAYDKEHNFAVCCIYDDGKTRSNEFCLPPVAVKSLCA